MDDAYLQAIHTCEPLSSEDVPAVLDIFRNIPLANGLAEIFLRFADRSHVWHRNDSFDHSGKWLERRRLYASVQSTELVSIMFQVLFDGAGAQLVVFNAPITEVGADSYQSMLRGREMVIFAAGPESSGVWSATDGQLMKYQNTIDFPVRGGPYRIPQAESTWLFLEFFPVAIALIGEHSIDAKQQPNFWA